MTIEQAAASFGWDELLNFSRHLPATSATHRALNKDVAEWSATLKTNMILADIFDAVRLFNFTFSKGNEEPKPYKRPFSNNGAKRIGSSPIPIKDFKQWYYGGDA